MKDDNCRVCKEPPGACTCPADKVRRREIYRRYREAHPEEIRERERRWREAHKEERREHERERVQRWRDENPAIVSRQWYRYRDHLRSQVFGHYGRECACCGTTDRLSIDHINGDGKTHRVALFGRERESTALYRWLINEGFPEGFQILCNRCNSSKHCGDRCRLDHGPSERDQ